MEKAIDLGIDAGALADQILRKHWVNLSGLRVFVAEDEQMLLWALEGILEELGCEVAGTANKVADALAFVEGHAFDVAILDENFSDGHIGRVADFLIARGTPIVVTSGGVRAPASANGTTGFYLQKPYKDIDLERVLRAAVA